MALLCPRTDNTLQSEDLVEGDPGPDIEDAQHCGVGRIYSQVGLSGDDNDSMDGLLESMDPVGVELAVDGGAGITEVLRVGELAAAESGVTNVVMNSELNGMLAVEKPTLTMLRPYLGKAGMRERDIDVGQPQELGDITELSSSFLMSSNLRTVVLDLRSGGDVRYQKAEPLPECGNVVVDLEEQIVLNLLRKAETRGIVGKSIERKGF